MRRDGLIARRHELQLSQEELAERLRLSTSTVARTERGESTPRSAHRRRWANALDMPLDELERLFKGGDRTPSGTTVDLGGIVTRLEQVSVTTARHGPRQPLLRLLGHAHEAMGEVAFDRLQFREAADHFQQAHEVGIELGDPDLTAAAVIQLGDIARRRRRHHAALRLLRSAEDDASTASLLTQVRRSQTLARTYAETADHRSFDQAIGRAQEIAERVPAEHHRQGDHSPQGLQLEKAQGLTLLGHPRAALKIYAESAPTSFSSDRDRGSFLIIHAQALAHAGHLDEGVRLAIEGLELARSYGSPRHVSRVQRMHDRLTAAWPASEPRLVELRDALAAAS